jgi:hypothetical protein
MHPKVTTYPKGKSSVSICHERGGTIVSLIINGIEILYNDPERRNNPQIKPRESFMM